MESNDLYSIIISVLAEEATEEERLFFTNWLEESDSNRQEFESIKRLYQLSVSSSPNVSRKIYDTEQAFKKVCNQMENNQMKNNTGKKYFAVWMKYAAVIVLLIVSTGIILFNKYSKPESICEVKMKDCVHPTLLLDNGDAIDLTKESFSMNQTHAVVKNEEDLLSYQSKETENKAEISKNRLIVPHGQTYKLELSDGSLVWLNSQTELIYPTKFAGEKREVTLIGEAFFKVAKDTDHPFYVKMNGMEVKVLGTSFNISCYPEDIAVKTTLVEGSVSICPEGGNYKMISPSEQYTYNRENKSIKIQNVDIEQYTSWVKGRYIFRNESLEEIVGKLQRWYNFTINYQDETLKHRHYSLTIDREDTIDQLLEVINHTSDVKLEKRGTIINIYKQRR